MPATTQVPATHRTSWRWRLLALLAVVAWLAVGGIGGQKIGQLSGLQDNATNTFVSSDVESVRAATQAEPFRDSEALPLFVVVENADGLTREQLGEIQEIVATLPDAPLATSGTVGELLLGEPAVIPAEDGQAVLVQLGFDAEQVRTERDGEPLVGQVSDAVGQAFEPLSNAGVWRTGPLGFITDISAAFAGIDGLLLIVALIVVFVILVVVYRSPFLPIVVLLSAVFGLSAAGLVIYPLAEAGYVQVSGQSQGILSILVVGAATDYALLIVARYREELRHRTVGRAMVATWKGTVAPIAASAATVIAGLMCLLLSGLEATRSLGPISALGILGALLGALTFLPAMLLLVGRGIFWPRIPRAGGDETERDAGGWWSLARWIGRHPRAVWMGTTTLLLVCALAAPTLRATGLADDEIFRNDAESIAGEAVLAEHFPGVGESSIDIVAPQADADALVSELEGIDGVREAAVVAVPGRGPVVVDGDVLIQATLVAPPISAAAQDTATAIREAVADDGLLVGGATATALDSVNENLRDVTLVMPAILAVVFIILVFVLRSLVAPLILVVANIVSFLATLGISALVFNHVFGFANADPATPMYAFVFLIALGIDYSIFLATRIREEAPKIGTRPAVVRGLAITGGVITSAGIVLAATFSALFVLPLVFMAQIAFFVAFGVLLDTLVVRSLVVPGIVHDLGDKVWWPGKPMG